MPALQSNATLRIKAHKGERARASNGRDAGKRFESPPCGGEAVRSKRGLHPSHHLQGIALQMIPALPASLPLLCNACMQWE